MDSSAYSRIYTQRPIIRLEELSTMIRLISYGNRIELSPIRFVIIRVITKSDDRAICLSRV